MSANMECPIGMPMHCCAEPDEAKVGSKLPFLTLNSCFTIDEVKRGRYSVISKACCDGFQVAVKTYDRPTLVPKKQKMATREAIVLKYLNAQGVPNITHMWSAYASQDKFHILMEYCSGGNLLDRLKAAAVPFSEEQLAASIAAPLLRTVAAMHAAGVTHRDIKLENIFTDSQGHPKLGDFDLAVFQHEPPARAPVGTIFYMAPEVLLLASAKGTAIEALMQRRVSEKMDVWSLGVCLFELAAGYKPFQGVSYEGVASAIIQMAMAELPCHLSSAFRSFIAAALTYDPTQRPSAEQLLQHPWIQMHSPTAGRSDSACSLTDVSCKGSMQQQQQPQVSSKAHRPWQHQQQHCNHRRSSSGSSSDVAGSGSSFSSYCSAGSAMLKCSSREVPCGGMSNMPNTQHSMSGGGVAAVAAVAGIPSAGMFSAGPAVWTQQQQQTAATAYAAAVSGKLHMHNVPGQLWLRNNNNSSLGTHHGEWSTTTDSSATCCSPHSIMHRMGLSSSGTLGRQLMPWATAGSSGLGFNTVTNSVATPGIETMQQQQQLVQEGGSLQPLCVQAAGGSSSSSGSGGVQQPLQQQLTPGDGASGASAVDAVRSSVTSSSSSNTSPTQPAVNAPASQAAYTVPAGAPRANVVRSSSAGGSQQQQSAPAPSPEAAAAAAAAAATAAAAASSQMSPLALAVAAAVAEHNKKQPRMWTPFALRVHQLRVAQVLLAERQRVTSQPPPPPPAQPLVPLRLPVVHDDEQHNAAQDQQQQQQRAAVDQPSPVAARQAECHQQQRSQQQQEQVISGPAAEPVSSLTVHQTAQPAVSSTIPRSAGPVSIVPPAQRTGRPGMGGTGARSTPAAGAAAAVVAEAAAQPAAAGNVMVRPLVHHMQQQLSMGRHDVGGGSSSVRSSSSSGVSIGKGPSDASKPLKPAKKTWLACFVPRAFD